MKFGSSIFKLRDISIINSEFYKNQKEKKKEKILNSIILPKNALDKKIDNFDTIGVLNKKSSDIVCRFCLNDNFDSDNFLINPCKCSGSMKYIHYNCLKKWIKSKIEIRKSIRLITFKFNTIECELCKSEIPGIESIKLDTFIINKSHFSIIELDLPNNANYIAFENILKQKDAKRYIYLIPMYDKTSLIIVMFIKN